MPIFVGRYLLGRFARTRVRPSGEVPLRDPWHLTFTSFAECQELLAANAEIFRERRLMERHLEEQLGERQKDAFAGFCWVCSRPRRFVYDRKYSDGIHVNWRERLECPACRLNNRLRLSVQVIERVASRPEAIYLTEQVTPLATCLAGRYRNLAMSEYLGDALASGSTNRRGVRHEDVTALSFGDQSFDHVLSFDVLEHVPNYRQALAEFRRVLRDDGNLLLSVPFALLSEGNIVRARIAPDGSVDHLLPPEYHGDPVDPRGGILCYYHFGWELLENLKEVGFRSARIDAYWSEEYGHIGDEQLVIVATR
jgi:Methyltransferase domain